MGGTDPGRLATMAKEITIFHCDDSMVASNSTIGYSPPVLTNKVATKEGRVRHSRVRPGGGGDEEFPCHNQSRRGRKAAASGGGVHPLPPKGTHAPPTASDREDSGWGKEG